MSASVIECRNVTDSCGRGENQFTALTGIDLAVAEGESLSIVGKSGSDESTLMHTMALLDHPSSGTVSVSGTPTGNPGGQKQRVVIARGLITNSSLIFADEPTGDLVATTEQIVEHLLFDLNREHCITLIVVTRDPDLASRCGRRATIHVGRLASLTPTAEKEAAS